MSTISLIKRVGDDSTFGLLLIDDSSIKAYPVCDSSADWASWVNSETKSLDEIGQTLGFDLYLSDPRAMKNDQIKQFVPSFESESSTIVGGPRISSRLSYVGTDDGVHRRYVVTDFDAKSFPVSPSGLPLHMFSPESRSLAMAYKVWSAKSDSLRNQVGYAEKKVRAIFDPNLGPKGGYRCPQGTEFGGYITDRFGRGCGTGIIRRVGQAIGQAGRRIERIGEDRQLNRLQRAERRANRMTSRPGGGAAPRAERAAVALERGAERVVRGGRADRRNIPGGRTPTSRTVVTRPGATRRRVIVPPAGQRVRTQGQRPVPRPVNQGGRRGTRLVDVWTPSEYRRGDSRRIKNRQNRYAGQPDRVVRQALNYFRPRPIRNEEDRTREARRRQQRLEVLQEMVNRGMDIPEEYRREVRVYKLKPQRARRSGGRNERAAVALERAAERVLRGRDRRARRRERQNGLNRRDRMARALERGAERVLNGRRTEEREIIPPSRPPVAPSARAKKRTAPRPAQTGVRRPQPKRQTGVTLDKTKLTPSQKRAVSARMNLEERELDARWRRRLKLDANERITPEMIQDYIREREGQRSGGYIGVLRADANDWDVLNEYRQSKNLDLFNQLGPTRRKKISNDAKLSGTPSQRKKPTGAPGTKKPAPKPSPGAKKPTEAKKPSPKKTPAKPKAETEKKPKAEAERTITPATPRRRPPIAPRPKIFEENNPPVDKKPEAPAKPSKAPAATKPKATTSARAKKPTANQRQLRTTDAYKKAKADQERLTRMNNDLVSRMGRRGNRESVQRQVGLIDNEIKKYDMALRNTNMTEARRAQALASLEGLRKRRAHAIKVIDSIKPAGE